MSDANYNPLKQFDIYNIMLYREGWVEQEKFDIKEYMFEFVIYEDLFDPSISATLTLGDFGNLPDNFPIVGGERVDIFFKTPVQQDIQKLQFVVGKVSDRYREMDNSKYQSVSLELVTPERYLDVNMDVSSHFEGPYSDIIKKLLGRLNTKKKIQTDDSVYNQNFIAPYWSPLKCCGQIAKRAMGSKFEPFLFFETLDGYNFKSIKTLYDAQPYATLRIDNGRRMGEEDEPDKKLRRVLKYEYLDSSDRMRQFAERGFGTRSEVLDPVVKRFGSQIHDYTTMSSSKDYYKVDKYQLYDNMSNQRDKMEIVLTRADKSHEGHHYRQFFISLIDNYRLKVLMPGDSNYRVGQIVELDVPDKSVANYLKEQTTSGRWLVASLKHMIRREAYSTVLELVKDSHSKDIVTKVKGKPQYDNDRAPTGGKSPEPAEQATDE